MSDVSQGPGWWLASDGRWYPPETHPQAQAGAQAGPEAHGENGALPPEAAMAPTGGAPAEAGGGQWAPTEGGVAAWGPAYQAPYVEPAAAGAAPPYAADTAPQGSPGTNGTSLPGQGAAPYGWAVPVAPCRHQAVAPALFVLGLAAIAWGVGAIFNAMATVNAHFPHDEQVGAWISAGALLAIGLTVAVLGIVLRRR